MAQVRIGNANEQRHTYLGTVLNVVVVKHGAFPGKHG